MNSQQLRWSYAHFQFSLWWTVTLLVNKIHLRRKYFVSWADSSPLSAVCVRQADLLLLWFIAFYVSSSPCTQNILALCFPARLFKSRLYSPANDLWHVAFWLTRAKSLFITLYLIYNTDVRLQSSIHFIWPCVIISMCWSWKVPVAGKTFYVSWQHYRREQRQSWDYVLL